MWPRTQAFHTFSQWKAWERGSRPQTKYGVWGRLLAVSSSKFCISLQKIAAPALAVFVAEVS